MPTDELLSRYDEWLEVAAHKLVGRGHALFDDCVQEGRIAMWKEVRKNGGLHAGFMTHAAKLRMGQIAAGEKAFGGVKVAVRDVKPVANVEQFDVEISPAQADIADAAMWAYHRGSIYRAIEALPPGQRAAVRVFLADGVMTGRERASWADARAKLSQELAHLRNLVGSGRVQGPGGLQ